MFVGYLNPQNYSDNTLKYFHAQNQTADVFYSGSSKILTNTTLKGVLAPTAALPSSGLTLKPHPNSLSMIKKHQLLPKSANNQKYLSNIKNDKEKAFHPITPNFPTANNENLQVSEQSPINISSVKNSFATFKDCETVSNESLSFLIENKISNFESSSDNKCDNFLNSLTTQPLSTESSTSSTFFSETKQERLFSSTVSNYHAVSSNPTSVVGMRDASIYSSTVNLCKESSMPCKPKEIKKPTAFDYQPLLENLKTVSKNESQLPAEIPESALSKSDNTCVSISSLDFQVLEQSGVTNNINPLHYISTLDNNIEKSEPLKFPIGLKKVFKNDNTVDKKNKIIHRFFTYQYYLELERIQVIIFEQQAYYQQEIDRLRKQLAASDHEFSQLSLNLSDTISTTNEINAYSIRNIKSEQNDVLEFDKTNLFQSLADVISYFQKAVLKFQNQIYHQYQTIKFLTLESDSLTERLESQMKIINDKTNKLNCFRLFGSELDLQIFNQKEKIEKINQSLAGRDHLKNFEQAINAKASKIDASSTNISDLVEKIDFCFTIALTKLSSDIELMRAVSGCQPCFPKKALCQNLTSHSQKILVNSGTTSTEADVGITQKTSVVKIPRKSSKLLISSDSNFFKSPNSQNFVESNQIHLDGDNKSPFFPERQTIFQIICDHSTDNCKVEFANEENTQKDLDCCKFKTPTLINRNKNQLKQAPEIRSFLDPEAEKMDELVVNLGIIFENLKVVLNAFCFLQKARNKEIENLKLEHNNGLEKLQNEKNMSIFDLETKIKLAKRNLVYFKHENLRLTEMEKGTSDIVNREATSNF